MQKEPLLTVGAITAIVSALLVFLQSMGVNITDDQQEAIRNLVAVLAPIVLALVARQFVYAPATVEKIADQQYTAGVPPTEPQPDVPPPAAV
jgi:Mn2+/Fe2+ NRAMP family transporter